jgi:hypothetical protein
MCGKYELCMVGQKLGRNLASVKTVLVAEPNFMEKER